MTRVFQRGSRSILNAMHLNNASYIAGWMFRYEGDRCTTTDWPVRAHISGAASGGSTTTLVDNDGTFDNSVIGQLLSMTSGSQAGTSRIIATRVGKTLGWASAMGGAVAASDEYIITPGYDLSCPAAPTAHQSDYPLGAPDGSMVGNATPATASANTIYDLSTEDWMMWAVVKTHSSFAANQGIFNKAKFVGAHSDDLGYWLATDTSGRFWARWSAQDNTKADIVSAAVSASTWYMVHAFGDTSEASTNGSQIYVNGKRSGSGVDISAVTSVTNTHTFKVGTKAEFTEPFLGQISAVGMVADSALWPGGAANRTVWDAIALEHYRRWTEGVAIL